MYNIVNVHEACTKMGTNEYWAQDRKCSFWTDGHGTIFDGGVYLFRACSTCYCANPFSSMPSILQLLY